MPIEAKTGAPNPAKILYAEFDDLHSDPSVDSTSHYSSGTTSREDGSKGVQAMPDVS